MKVIAAQAGVTAGLVHYHFATKEAVLAAALQHGLAAYLARQQARRAATPPHRQIEAFFASVLDAAQPDRDFFKVSLALAGRAMTDAALATQIHETNQAAVAEVAMVFAATRAQGTASPADLALAATLKAACDGIMLALINDPAFPLTTTVDVLRQAVTASAEQPRLI